MKYENRILFCGKSAFINQHPARPTYQKKRKKTHKHKQIMKDAQSLYSHMALSHRRPIQIDNIFSLEMNDLYDLPPLLCRTIRSFVKIIFHIHVFPPFFRSAMQERTKI
jgi:hypothetical protein